MRRLGKDKLVSLTRRNHDEAFSKLRNAVFGCADNLVARSVFRVGAAVDLVNRSQQEFQALIFLGIREPFDVLKQEYAR
jgi:hypothetical protein